ncbi:PadR family transcriptional regulator [Streptomyces rapamycinicus]|uniref:PadR family transcriptional regulator n=2 Tax=Streptomyces rapamycinicus TaxID=1226757 RepID=A0A3L8QZJ0_STRRN|nr:helix-turn-helix transcriptional regulator [Streptomyces rapamycinicus]MBB4788362.1 DNA-binding PadR family transcriptional regulator [Streptomyces rapamycinicus]RLV72697.1 PadR family transcriptional regulator [Streptomyces rapamycinicus NRRL 5491]UTP36037.1 helix-turn-helix transcriptional regulator [Streptomyces rapamycinicus NRRL 5491]
MRADRVRGHLDGLLMAVLEQGPLHGYAIITAVQRRSGGVLDLRTGTIYPALNKLERLGLLTSSWESVGERRRRSYQLTDAGRRSLAEERTAWREFTMAIGSVLNPGAEPRSAV